MPRLLMAGIIGVCISAPLEIRILKPEIDAELELQQNKYLGELNAHAENQVEVRKQDLVKKFEDGRAQLRTKSEYFEKRRVEINAKRHQLELEAEGKTGSGIAGRGPAWRDKKENLDKLEAELEDDKSVFAEKEKVISLDVKEWRKAIDALAEELELAKASNVRQSRHLDGLMQRIRISHEIGGLVPFAIMLLLLAVETGPIFFKMMLIRSTYDYELENAKRVATAKLGVELDAQIFLTEMNEEVRLDIYHQVKASLAEEQRRLQSEEKLAAAVHERFAEDIEKDVRQGDSHKKYIRKG